MDERQYSEEAAREILKRAVDMQVREKDFTEAQLREMAQELGVSEAALAEAKKSWLTKREQREELQSLEEERREFNAHRRREFYNHLVAYVIVNTFLFLLNVVTSFGD